MDRLDGFATNLESGSAGTFSLGHRTMEGGKAFQVGLQAGAKGRVKGVAVHTNIRQSVSFILSVVNLP